MSVYSVEGKLRVGKTKFAVWMAQAALRQGLRVASNVDLFPAITPERPRPFIRIPDKPSAEDLDAIGHGNPESYDEERNGVLILDELGTWLNARSFQDKGRAGVIDWLIHSGKLGWHIYIIVQDASLIDKQVREAIIEYSVRVMRFDKVRIPFVGNFLGALGGMFGATRWGYLPRFHQATARVGYGPNAIVAEVWRYRGDDLHAAYDTRQAFSTSYPHGTHSVLPPWDYVRPLPWLERRKLAFAATRESMRYKPVAPKPKLALVEKVMQLPPHRRIEWMRRIEREAPARAAALKMLA